MALATLHMYSGGYKHSLAENGRLVLGRGAPDVAVDIRLDDLPLAPVQLSATALIIECAAASVALHVYQRLPGFLLWAPTGAGHERHSVSVDSPPLLTSEPSIELTLVLGNMMAGAVPIGTLEFAARPAEVTSSGTKLRPATYPTHTWVRWLAGAYSVSTRRPPQRVTVERVRMWFQEEGIAQQPTDNTEEAPRALRQALYFFGLITDPTAGRLNWPEALNRLWAAGLPPESLVQFALRTRYETGWATPATVHHEFMIGNNPMSSTTWNR
jgi:hypothetical protein